jgi:hypothetical protein
MSTSDQTFESIVREMATQGKSRADIHAEVDRIVGDEAAARAYGGERCHCGNPADEEHTCPFAEEIHGRTEPACRCCPDCTRECANDI